MSEAIPVYVTIIGSVAFVIVVCCCLNCACVFTINKLCSVCKRRKEEKRSRAEATQKDKENRRARIIQMEMRERIDSYNRSCNRSYSTGYTMDNERHQQMVLPPRYEDVTQTDDVFEETIYLKK